MGFGAIIASGEKNRLLRGDLVGGITEVRVEQSLDDPTRFAIRFQDDSCGGDFEVMNAPELQCGTMITVAVKVADKAKCLVRGPITDVRSSIMLGGPGSWYQVHGEDRRIELDRQCVPHRWSGRASDAADTILKSKFEPKIQKTNIIYGSRRVQGQEVLEQKWEITNGKVASFRAGAVIATGTPGPVNEVTFTFEQLVQTWVSGGLVGEWDLGNQGP